jgi:hypothetical protein
MGELADPAGGIVGDFAAQTLIVNVATVGIRRTPFPDRECASKKRAGAK